VYLLIPVRRRSPKSIESHSELPLHRSQIPRERVPNARRPQTLTRQGQEHAIDRFLRQIDEQLQPESCLPRGDLHFQSPPVLGEGENDRVNTPSAERSCGDLRCHD